MEGNSNSTYCGRRDLGEIYLIMRLRIAQSILVPIGLVLPFGATSQGLNVAVIFHFEIDTDAAIQWRVRYIDVQVLDASFDDFCEFLSRLLVMADANLYGVASTLFKEVLDSRR